MSDLTKAQATHQSDWHTCRTSLGANGVPDELIKEDLQQPIESKFPLKKDQKIIK
jgi:hypothetical protein